MKYLLPLLALLLISCQKNEPKLAPQEMPQEMPDPYGMFTGSPPPVDPDFHFQNDEFSPENYPMNKKGK